MIFAGAGFKRHVGKRRSTAHEPPSVFFPFQKGPLSYNINALIKEKKSFEKCKTLLGTPYRLKIKIKEKGKVFPLHARCGPEGG